MFLKSNKLFIYIHVNYFLFVYFNSIFLVTFFTWKYSLVIIGYDGENEDRIYNKKKTVLWIMYRARIYKIFFYFLCASCMLRDFSSSLTQCNDIVIHKQEKTWPGIKNHIICRISYQLRHYVSNRHKQA